MNDDSILPFVIVGALVVAAIWWLIVKLAIWVSETEPTMTPNRIEPLSPSEAAKWSDYKRIRNMPR